MKQRMKQLLAVLLSALLLLAAMPALTAAAETLSGSCGENVTWELDTQTGVLVLDGTGPMADYPNSYETPWRFHSQEIREVVIGEQTTRLGNNAFAGCQNLEKVSFACSTDEDCPDDNQIECPGDIDTEDIGGLGAPVTVQAIPEAALTGDSDAGDPDADCDLVIGDHAFHACSALVDVTIPGRVTHIGKYAFAECSLLRRVVIEENAGPTVTPGGIDPGNFDLGCSSVTVEAIPEAALTGGSDECGGRSIDNFAFCSDDALRYIHIPSDVTDIGEGILAGEGYCYICSDTENCAAKTYADREFIDFRLCTGHVDFVDLFGTCGKDGDDLTWELDEFTGTLTISGTGEMADYDSYYPEKAPWVNWKMPVRTIVIEDGVTRIGANTFYDCEDLTSVTIPESVTSIGESAFEFCTSLQNVTIPQGVTQIEDCAFCHCHNLADVTIPDAVTQIDQFAFFDCRSFKHVTIPDGVTTIGTYAFAECETLESVTIPDSVTSLGNYAFYNCESLQSVTMPAALQNTGYRVFYGCPKTLKFYTNHEHSYGEPEWQWADDYSAATATFKCALCDDTQTVTADVDTAYISTADCENDCIAVFTANVLFGDMPYTDRTDEVILATATGHYWLEPVWTWAPDYSEATATFECALCGKERNEPAYQIEEETLEEAGCSTNGVVRYLAETEIDGRTYTGISDEIMTAPLTEHAYGEPVWQWADDYSAATATFRCANCDDMQTETADVDMAVLSEQSCTTDYVVSYTAAVTFGGADYTDTKTGIVLATATGHNYGEPEWQWTNDYSAATATFRCANCGDVQTVTDPSPVAHEITPASETNDQVVTCTATVFFAGCEYSDTTEEIDVPGTAILRKTAFAAAGDTRVERIAGNTVTMTVELTNNPGIISAILCIGYDAEQLQLVEVRNGSVFDDSVFMSGGDLLNNPFTVIWADGHTHEDITQTGTLVTLTFAVQPTATVGTTTVTVTCQADSVYDVDLHPVTMQTSDGTVELYDRMPGDVTDDKTIDLKDVVTLSRYLAGWNVQINERNADVNADGKVDIIDLILLMRFLVGGWDVVLV